MPKGVCCPFYEDGLGTLHSMVFDTTEISVQVCFGAASPQKWETISFNSPCENSKIQVPINNEFPLNPKTFWEHLNPKYGAVSSSSVIVAAYHFHAT